MRNDTPHGEITTYAGILHGPGRAAVEERRLRPLASEEVLLKDLLCGICGSDTAMYRGDAPVIKPVWLGHEFGGVVEAVGSDVTDLEPGDEVAAWIPPGWEFGGLGERTIVQGPYCVEVPRDDAWALEPLMCVVNAVIETQPPQGPLSSRGRNPLVRYGRQSATHRHIVVLGTGMMAQLAIALSALELPYSLTVIGRRQAGLERAMELGATRAINSSEFLSPADVEAAVREQNERVDVVYEAIGTPESLAQALAIPRMNGTVAILGYHQSHDGLRELNMADVMGWRAIKLVSGHTRDAVTAGLAPEEDSVMPAMRFGAFLLRQGVIDLNALREPRTYALAELPDALDAAAKSGSGKVLVDSRL